MTRDNNYAGWPNEREAVEIIQQTAERVTGGALNGAEEQLYADIARSAEIYHAGTYADALRYIASVLIDAAILADKPRMVITAWNVRNDATREYTVESFKVTYQTLRCEVDGEMNEEFAVYDEKCQKNNPTPMSSSPDGWVFHDGFIASDFTVSEIPRRNILPL